MLRVTLIGNLGAEPEIRYSQNGQPVATVSVAGGTKGWIEQGRPVVTGMAER